MRKNERRRLRHIADESTRFATREFNRARRNGLEEFPPEAEAKLSVAAIRVAFSKMVVA